MTDMRGFLSKTRALALVAGFFAGCGSGGGSGPDAAPSTGADAGGGLASVCADDGGVAPMLCTCNPALASATDLSGTWVLKTVGAQTVTAPTYPNPFHLKSIGVILVQIVQTGNEIALTGHYCDRIQDDDPKNPAKVIVLDAWRLTPFPIERSGSFAPDDSGRWVLTLPSTLPSAIEVAGADLVNPATDLLPTDPTDPRLVDSDNDGYPGISVGLSGLITGTLRSVQRQSTTLRGLAVAANRVEGGMAYQSDQSIVASDPPNIKDLYKLSTSSTDPAVCSSAFVMVKVSDDTDAGAVDCDWVRANEATLLGP
jgi:hypothetical protein